MGHLFSSQSTTTSTLPKSSTLIQHAIDGDLESIKVLVGKYIASYENSEALVTAYDPNLQRYIDLPDSQGNTPLIGAVFKDHVDIASFLLEKCGADYTIKNDLGCSPLWIVSGYSNISCLNYLIDHVLSKEIPAEEKIAFLSQKNKNGDSPFLAAASRGSVVVMKTLFQAIEKCSMVDDVVIRQQWSLLCTKNKAGDTSISVAAGGGFKECVNELLLMEDKCITRLQNDEVMKIERVLNMKNSNRLTPLMIACERNHQEIVQLLMEHNAIITVDSKERSPLAIASFCGCLDVAEYLLSLEKFKAMLNEKDVNNCTPLWLAARTGNLKMVKLLLEAGADASIVGAEGLSILEVAEKFKKDTVVSYIKDANIC